MSDDKNSKDNSELHQLTQEMSAWAGALKVLTKSVNKLAKVHQRSGIAQEKQSKYQFIGLILQGIGVTIALGH